MKKLSENKPSEHPSYDAGQAKDTVYSHKKGTPLQMKGMSMPRGKRKTDQSTQHIKQRTLMTRMLLFQPRPTATDDDLEALFKAAHGMQSHIPCLVAVTTGENQSHQHKGWTHGIVLHFEDEQHMQGALEHKAYQSMFPKLTALCEALVIFDISQQLPLVIQEVVQPVPPPAPKPSHQEKSTKPTPLHEPSNARWRRAPLVARVDPRLVALTVEQLEVDDTEVMPRASLVEDLNADSLDLVEYIMTLEQTFHIQISDEDAEQLTTISEIQNYLLEKEVL